MKASLTSPNGQWGCLYLELGQFVLTAGFLPGLFGVDVGWGERLWTMTWWGWKKTFDWREDR